MNLGRLRLHLRDPVSLVAGLLAPNRPHDLSILQRNIQVFHRPDIWWPAKDLEIELIEFCRQHLSPVKCPRSIDFDPELPRHANGKLYKRLIKDRYWGASTIRGSSEAKQERRQN